MKWENMTREEIQGRLDLDTIAMWQFEGCGCIRRYGYICSECSRFEFDFLRLDELREMERVVTDEDLLQEIKKRLERD